VKYRLTVLTPLLAGDGQRLSPIDYMIWRDQVNVLNQTRIFKLLARGPRLDPYLAQLRRADKLDFASWGGFAQNYAGRRIPFEHASSTPIWNQTRAEHLFIPTFASGPSGPFLPGSVLKGALRTAYVWSRWNAGVLAEIGTRMEGERALRRPGAAAETMTLGHAGADPMRVVATGDSATVRGDQFRVYLVRVASLQPSKAGGALELVWKQAPRGSVPAQRVQDAAATFVEMAVPGAEFSGAWNENQFLRRPEVSRTLHWRGRHDSSELLRVANDWAASLLATQRQYAETARLSRLAESVRSVEAELGRARESGSACLVSLGWGGGLLTKTAFTDTSSEEYRRILRQLPVFAQAVRTGMPFPKTRRIVFAGGEPAAFPGWARLEVD
jgi:CRISPR-associated protein Csm5